MQTFGAHKLLVLIDVGDVSCLKPVQKVLLDGILHSFFKDEPSFFVFLYHIIPVQSASFGLLGVLFFEAVEGLCIRCLPSMASFISLLRSIHLF